MQQQQQQQQYQIPVRCNGTPGTFLYPEERVVCECEGCYGRSSTANTDKDNKPVEKMRGVDWLGHCGLRATVRAQLTNLQPAYTFFVIVLTDC